MMDYMYQCIGVCDVTIACVIRAEVFVAVIGLLQAQSPHLEQHGSVEAKLVAHVSLAHPLFREDNQFV